MAQCAFAEKHCWTFSFIFNLLLLILLYVEHDIGHLPAVIIEQARFVLQKIKVDTMSLVKEIPASTYLAKNQSKITSIFAYIKLWLAEEYKSV